MIFVLGGTTTVATATTGTAIPPHEAAVRVSENVSDDPVPVAIPATAPFAVPPVTFHFWVWLYAVAAVFEPAPNTWAIMSVDAAVADIDGFAVELNAVTAVPNDPTPVNDIELPRIEFMMLAEAATLTVCAPVAGVSNPYTPTKPVPGALFMPIVASWVMVVPP